jgi:hypothetical protein
LTRGTDDVMLYMLTPQRRGPEEAIELAGLQHLWRTDVVADFDKIRDRVAAQRLARPVTEDDRALLSGVTAKAAQRQWAQRLIETILHPPAFVVDTVGERPSHPGAQRAWDAMMATILTANPGLTEHLSPGPSSDVERLIGARPTAASIWDSDRENLVHHGATVLATRGVAAVANAPVTTGFEIDVRERAAIMVAGQYVTQQPGSYLAQLLGPKPKKTDEHWVSAAVSVEQYRVLRHGAAPSDGVISLDEVTVAGQVLGPRPLDDDAGQRWDTLVAISITRNASVSPSSLRSMTTVVEPGHGADVSLDDPIERSR